MVDPDKSRVDAHPAADAAPTGPDVGGGLADRERTTTAARWRSLAQQTDAAAHEIVTTARRVSEGGRPAHAPVIAAVSVPPRPARETGHMLTMTEMASGAVSTEPGTSRFARWLRVVIGLLVALAFLLGHGLIALALTPEQRLSWMAQHQSTGITVLALVVVAMVWHFMRAMPDVADGQPAGPRLSGRVAGFVLVLLLAVLPVSGWLTASASASPVATRLFWLIPLRPLPALRVLPVAERQSMESMLAWLHAGFALMLALTICVHVALFMRGRRAAGKEP